jgi:hypothetical protein
VVDELAKAALDLIELASLLFDALVFLMELHLILDCALILLSVLGEFFALLLGKNNLLLQVVLMH